VRERKCRGKLELFGSDRAGWFAGCAKCRERGPWRSSWRLAAKDKRDLHRKERGVPCRDTEGIAP
jgi:hypothetical protein